MLRQSAAIPQSLGASEQPWQLAGVLVPLVRPGVERWLAMSLRETFLMVGSWVVVGVGWFFMLVALGS